MEMVQSKLIPWFWMVCPVCGWYGYFTEIMIMSPCIRCMKREKGKTIQNVGQMRWKHIAFYWPEDKKWPEGSWQYAPIDLKEWARNRDGLV